MPQSHLSNLAFAIFYRCFFRFPTKYRATTSSPSEKTVGLRIGAQIFLENRELLHPTAPDYIPLLGLWSCQGRCCRPALLQNGGAPITMFIVLAMGNATGNSNEFD